MLNFIRVLFCGVLFRLDGWGKGDGFLAVYPFCNWRSGGVNYSRYFIGFVVFGTTLNPLHILSYSIAAAIPYGENHWWMKKGLLSWFCIGALWGAASLSWGVSLWLGCLMVLVKKYKLDWSLTEFFILGMGSTLWLLWYK